MSFEDKVDYSRLFASLDNSRLATTNNALYQTIKSLIGAAQKFGQFTQIKYPGIGDGNELNLEDVINELISSSGIPEYDTDPVSPISGDAWVLRTSTGSIADGIPIGMLLALTYTNNIGTSSYQLSYQTLADTIVRVSLV